MKHQDRRSFLKLTGLGIIGATAMSQSGFTACGSPKTAPVKSGIGIQLYSIRDNMAIDVPGSLKKIADIGYQYLELAGYADGKFYGYTPEEFKKMVNDLGMEIISSHTSVEVKGVDTSNVDILAEAHAKLGARYCIQPWLVEERRISADSYKQFVAELNTIGGVMKKYDLQFGYHNHNFEFTEVDGVIPYTDIFMTESDPDLITFEIDLYWVIRAGYDPIKLLQDFPGRFQLFHMKDMEPGEERFFAPVGEGIIDFKEILKHKDTAGMKYMFVEQDSTRDGKAMEAVTTSFNNLKNKIMI